MADHDLGAGRRMRIEIINLTLCAVAVIAAGAAAEGWWLVGIGVWALIVAFLAEMVYRP
ncbi:hypothetical protein [Streptomyces sp. NPDC054787]